MQHQPQTGSVPPRITVHDPEWRDLAGKTIYNNAQKAADKNAARCGFPRNGARAGMGTISKLLFFLIILAGLAFVGFAYLGDLSPSITTVTEPVQLDVD